jgi:BirA family biotin operon repressor/biotin-[acetyl-CoA-carboxylase] ligase
MIAPEAPLYVLEEIDSTNEEARRRADAGNAGPLWLLARRQTAGRGRRGRVWTTIPGNLFLTYLGSTTRQPADIALLGFAAGLALTDACDGVIGQGRAKLKWPNDMLIDGRKTAGILLESGRMTGGALWFAIGMGLNIVGAPNDAQPTASLRDFLPADILAPDAEAIARDVAQGMAHWASVLAEEGFKPLREAWLARAHGLNGPARAALGTEIIEGIARDLTEKGELLIEIPGVGTRMIAAGDIYFLPSAS